MNKKIFKNYCSAKAYLNGNHCMIIYKVLKKILGNKKINLNNKAIGYNRRNYKIINFVKKILI